MGAALTSSGWIALAFGLVGGLSAQAQEAAPSAGYLQSGVALFNEASDRVGSFISDQAAKTCSIEFSDKPYSYILLKVFLNAISQFKSANSLSHQVHRAV